MSTKEIDLIWSSLDCYAIQRLTEGATLSEAKEIRKLAAGFKKAKISKKTKR